jgi:hypothetical protein
MTTDTTNRRDEQDHQPPQSAEADATHQQRTKAPPLSQHARWRGGALLTELAASAVMDDGPIGTRCRPIGANEEESE